MPSRNKPKPHGSKLLELAKNPKLPRSDRSRVEEAINRYEAWIESMDDSRQVGEEKIQRLVELLNQYKQAVELNLIWDSEESFLYRQRGQLKLDNSIIEEFLPRLVDPAIIPSLEARDLETGPMTTYSAMYFTTGLGKAPKAGGLRIRKKDQDFVIGRSAFLRVSHDSTFPPHETLEEKISLAFVAAECKTNLDKTMFQEAAATAQDLKNAVVGSHYYLLCEWLDMTPIATRSTSIDEVIILRGKRLASNLRSELSRSHVRRARREWYVDLLRENPIRFSSISRFVHHLQLLIDNPAPPVDDALSRGFF